MTQLTGVAEKLVAEQSPFPCRVLTTASIIGN